FPLALDHLLNFSLARSACHAGGAFGLRRRFLAGLALQLFAFGSICNVFGVHSSFIPAYFSTSLFSPWPGKLTVSLASSPSPSRRSTVPRPYRGCTTVEPEPKGFLRTAGLGGGGCGGVAASGACCFCVWGTMDGGFTPRSAKN